MIKIKKNGKVHKLPKLTNMFEERGHRIGRKKGKEIGKELGEKQEKEHIARNMLKDNLPTKTIKNT